MARLTADILVSRPPLHHPHHHPHRIPHRTQVRNRSGSHSRLPSKRLPPHAKQKDTSCSLVGRWGSALLSRCNIALCRGGIGIGRDDRFIYWKLYEGVIMSVASELQLSTTSAVRSELVLCREGAERRSDFLHLSRELQDLTAVLLFLSALLG